MEKTVILTGVKPTGQIHLGNYLGAIRPLIESQERAKNAEILLFVADLHTFTDPDFKEGIYANVVHLISAYCALGVDYRKVRIYRQSDFPEITQLQWILATLFTLPNLQIGHAYKDAIQRQKQEGLGLLLYPVLMAADVLLPGSDSVPVGGDQLQHLEIARDAARKFNNRFGNVFKEPRPLIRESVEIPGTDGRKMSKSYNNTLPIFESEEVIRKKITSIVTGGEPEGSPLNPDTCNVCRLYKFLASDQDYTTLCKMYIEGSINYKKAKEMLCKAFLSYFENARKNYDKNNSSAFAEKVIKKHRKYLHSKFSQKMEEVHKATTLL